MATMHRISKNNTTIRDEDGARIVRLHRTDIVTIRPTEIELHSGGWRTVTTKARMNQVSNELAFGFVVFAKRREWFVSFFDEDGTRTTCAFEDGMRIPRHIVRWNGDAWQPMARA